MSYEVEIKFRVADSAALKRLLTDLKAVAGAAEAHSDLYFNHPARDFARTDEVLRLRSIEGIGAWLSYKGPKLGGPVKTRCEIEAACADCPAARSRLVEILERLGFRRVLEVRKVRVPHTLAFQGRTLTVTLDEADGLGTFAEVETLVESPDELPAAQEAVRAVAGQLGLSVVEPRSYLQLALTAAGPA
jgi:adenylate cyclase class 2